MERFEILAGEFKKFEDVGLLLRYGEMFLNAENNNQELLIGVDYKGNWEKIGGKGVITFCGTYNAVDMLRLFSGDLKPITGGLYKISEDINLSPQQVEQLRLQSLCELNDPYTIPELNKGDLLLYSRVNDNDNMDGYEWHKVGATITTDVQAKFDPHSTNFESHTKYVQQALAEVDREKLEWGGIIDTLEETVTKQDIIDAIPGKNYSKLGKIYQVEKPFIWNNIYWDKHDFLILQSKSYLQYDDSLPAGSDYDVPLDDIDIYYRVAGNHWAAEQHYLVGQTRNIFHDGIYDDTYRHQDYMNVRDVSANDVYSEKDAAIRNEKQALDNLFETKADLDPETHKLLLSQIPLTIAGGWDYQGTFPHHRLPTAEDKTSDDTDTSHYHEYTQILVKGDYWAFTGEEWDVTELVRDGTIVSYGSFENDTHYAIKNGDLIVYDGDDKWGIVDNTEEFIGFTSESVNTSGKENNVDVPTGTDSKDVIDGIVRFVDSKRETTGTPEVIVTRDGNFIIYSNPESALVPEQADVNYFYKEKGHKELIRTGVSEFDNKLDIEEETATISLHNTDERVNITTQPKENVTDNTEGLVNVNTPTHSGNLMITEDIFTEHEDDKLLRYETDKWGNPIAVKSNLIDTDKELDITEDDVKVVLHNDKDKVTIFAQLADNVTNKDKTDVTINTPTHDGNLMVTEDIFTEHEDDRLLRYETDEQGNPIAVKSNVVDTDKKLKIEESDGQIEFTNNTQTANILINEQLTDEINLTLPNHTGTIGVEENVFAEVENKYLPVARTDSDGNRYYENSTLNLDDDNNLVVEQDYFRLKNDDSYAKIINKNSDDVEITLPDIDSTLATEDEVFDTIATEDSVPKIIHDAAGNPTFVDSGIISDSTTKDISFKNPQGSIIISNEKFSTEIISDTKNDVTLNLPSQSGTILMDNDIINCGCWRKGKLVTK